MTNKTVKPKTYKSRGRPRIILPEVQWLIETNRNLLKTTILDKLQDGKVLDWIDNIIAVGTEEGDVNRFKILLEIAMGKLVEENPEFILSDEEKVLILEWRKRKTLAKIAAKKDIADAVVQMEEDPDGTRNDG